MPITKAHVGAGNRTEITKLERAWKVANAKTIRRIVVLVLGLGGSLQDADRLNAEMTRRCLEAQATHGRTRVPGAKERARSAVGRTAGPRSPTISVPVPKAFVRRVTASGGLRHAVESGLAVALRR